MESFLGYLYVLFYCIIIICLFESFLFENWEVWLLVNGGWLFILINKLLVYKNYIYGIYM